jgi:hypothetical protein
VLGSSTVLEKALEIRPALPVDLVKGEREGSVGRSREAVHGVFII